MFVAPPTAVAVTHQAQEVQVGPAAVAVVPPLQQVAATALVEVTVVVLVQVAVAVVALQAQQVKKKVSENS